MQARAIRTTRNRRVTAAFFVALASIACQGASQAPASVRAQGAPVRSGRPDQPARQVQSQRPDRPRRPDRPDRVGGAPANAPTATVEFDLPPDLSTKARDGSFVVRGFEVGYFGTDPRPLRTLQVGRDSLQISGGTARVLVPLVPLPGNVTRATIRVRSLGSGAASDWSNAAGPVDLPTASPRARSGAAPPGDRPSPPPRAPRQALSPDVLASLPELKKALDELVQPGCSESDALAAFGRPQDLALAIAISRRHGLSFERLCSVVKGPPGQSLPGAVRQLSPSVDLRGELQGLRSEAMKLLGASPPGPRRSRP